MTGRDQSLSCAIMLVVVWTIALIVGFPQPLHAQNDVEDIIWVEAWRHETAQPIFQSTVDWTPSTRIPLLATVGEGRVIFYTFDEEGPKFIHSIDDLPEAPTTVHVRAIDSDHSDVWIGTESPGIVHVFRVTHSTGDVHRRDRIRFAWDDVVELIPFDLDNWGELDLALRTQNQTLLVFRWTESGYVEVPLGTWGRRVTAVSTGPALSDRGQDLVLTRGEDHVVVLRWQLSEEAIRRRREDTEFERLMHMWENSSSQHSAGAIIASQPTGDGGAGTLVPVWDNYVWGTHTALFVGDFRGNEQQQIVVLSSQNLIYVYEWHSDTGTIVPVGSPYAWQGSQVELIGVGDLHRHRSDQLIQKTEAGIAAWKIMPTPRLIRTLKTSSADIDTVFWGPDNSMVVTGQWGFSHLVAREGSYLKVLQRGREVSLVHPAIQQDGTYFLSADDWRQITGVLLRHNAQSGRIIGVRGLRFVVGHETGHLWSIDGRTVNLDHTPLLYGETLYLPITFGQALGATLTWEPYSYTLHIER